MASKKLIAERLAAVPMFDRCTKRDIRTIARHAETATLAAESTVIVEGEPGETFFLLIEGTVSVSQAGIETTVLGPGAHFGELALLDPAPRSATVTAVTEVEVAALSLRMFRVLLRDMPQVANGLLASLADQLRRSRQAGSS